jgi:CBS domain-containing protein
VVLDDEGSVVGIITERDLVKRVCTKDLPSSSVTIQNVISSPVKTVSTKATIEEVADAMVRNKIRHVAVVAEENPEPLGVVSVTDIV